MEPTDEDFAWCAGFFDGEGHVSYRRSLPNPKTGRVSPKLLACVPQQIDNLEVLEYFQSVIGFGEISNPYTSETAYNGKLTTRRELRFRTRQVWALFEILKPWLRSKKTADFERALYSYKNHSPQPVLADWIKVAKSKKRKEQRDVKNITRP